MKTAYEFERPPWELDTKIRRPVAPKVRNFADALFTCIINGDFRYGTRLPAERVLCEKYNLSRNTVRQALALLGEYEVIERIPGSGSVVSYRPSVVDADEETEKTTQDAAIVNLTEVGEITSPLELGVVRSIIEPEIARLAVLSMTSRDIQRMNKIQAEIEQITVDGARFCELDDALRMQIAQGTHNPLLIVVYQMINHVNQNADWATQQTEPPPTKVRGFSGS